MLTSEFDLNDALGFDTETGIIPGLSEKFSPGQLVDRLGDRLISASVTATVNGQSLEDALKNATLSGIVDEIGGATIGVIADGFGHDTFSLEKLAMKAVTNCLINEAKGGECSSGVLGSVVVDVALEAGLTANNYKEYQQKIALLAATAGYLVSGGNAAMVYGSMDAASLDFENNAWVGIVIRLIVGSLFAADVVITVSDAYDLTKAGMDCDAGVPGACERTKELLEQFAIETGIELGVGAILPGSKVGVKIASAIKEKGGDAVSEGVDRAIADSAANAVGATRSESLGELSRVLDGRMVDNAITINGRTIIAETQASGPSGAAVFKNVSDSEIFSYFRLISGAGTMPSARNITISGQNVTIYTVKTPEGNFMLRSGSTSTLPSGAAPRWTIDVPGGAVNSNAPKKEVKFE